MAGGGTQFANQGGKAGGCFIPDGATAVEASVTAVSPSTNGFFRAWPAGQGTPNATFLNYSKGKNITNTGAIALAPTGLLDLAVQNYAATTHYVIDVQGYFVAPAAVPAGATGSVYVPISPCRVVDTRGKVGAVHQQPEAGLPGRWDRDRLRRPGRQGRWLRHPRRRLGRRGLGHRGGPQGQAATSGPGPPARPPRTPRS